MGTLDSDVTVHLSQVLEEPYQLVYAIPLLVFSLPITFAAAFLTLDRTRTFTPTPTTMSTRSRGLWQFQGGVGGMLGGWALGVHLSTLLSLFIMNRAPVAILGPVQFLVIWVLSSVFLSVLATRFKKAAVLCLTVGGGFTFAMFVSVITHPAMLARIILLGVLSSILAILALVPIPVVRHGAVRMGGASLGAFGVILGCSILVKATSWENVWERLWVSSSTEWGTPQEKGLSAAYAVLICAGVGADWALKRKFGENPDERWDSYLASYAANLPGAHDRPGTFRPAVGFWKRLTNPPPKDPIAFPPDAALGKRSSVSDPLFMAAKLKSRTTIRPKSQNTLKPLAAKGTHYTSDSSSSSSDSETDIPRPWAKHSSSRASLSGATLAGSHNDSKSSKGKGKGVDAEYSDGESVAPGSQGPTNRDAPGWAPGFMKRHSGSTAKDLEAGGVELDLKTVQKDSNPDDPLANPSSSKPPSGAVPITPSLIKALDRVSRAQSDAYSGTHTTPTSGGGYEWGAFWKAVGAKTQEPNAPPFPASNPAT